MPSPESGFIFALVNPGSEKGLKTEVGMERPDWRLSYQRRGFVTFKSDTMFSLESLDAPLACARRLCLSLGRFASAEDAAASLEPHSKVIQRARYQLRKMEGIGTEGPILPGTWIGTIVELATDEFWAGLHRHAAFLSRDPAGDPGLVMPAESPSRAWLKLEEAIRFFDLSLTEKDLVVELGASPGGVVLALLNLGVPVIGVDPAKMADIVMASAIPDRQSAPIDRPWFYHCRKPAALVSKRDLGSGVTWFMSDMNQTPEVVLTECARFCKMSPGIHGVLLTLKLTDLCEVARKHEWFAALAALGFQTIRLQQFSAHHKEFALLALRNHQRG